MATYHCNFRCEMCNIWQKKSVNEMTPEEVGLFFDRWSQFNWVHLTGGELFMRRDLDDLVAAIQKYCRSLYLLNFPTTGWFGDKTISLVERTLARGVGRLMVTISLDGPKALHEEMRGLPGSFDKALETFRRLRGIKRSNFQTVIGMTLMAKNAAKVDETLAAIREVIPDFRRSELHLNVGHESGHYFDNVGKPVGESSRGDPARGRGPPQEERLVAASGEVPRGPLPGAHQPLLRDRQVAAALHGALLLVLRRRVLESVSLLDLEREGRQPARQRLRPCAPCGTSPAVASCARTSSRKTARSAGRRARRIRRFLGNLARAAVSRGTGELQPAPAETS